MDLEGIPQRLRHARLVKDMSRSKAADALGVHDNTLAAWEKGTNDLPLLKAIALCDLYAITINELIGDTSTDEAVLDLKEIARRLKALEDNLGTDRSRAEGS